MGRLPVALYLVRRISVLRLKMPRGLSSGLLAILFCCCAPRVRADAPSTEVPYRLHFFHTHTGERLDIVYRHGEAYDPDALARLNTYLRDHRTGDVHLYDPRV